MSGVEIAGQDGGLSGAGEGADHTSDPCHVVRPGGACGDVDGEDCYCGLSVLDPIIAVALLLSSFHILVSSETGGKDFLTSIPVLGEVLRLVYDG